MLLIIILIMLFFLVYIRISNNNDLIYNNTKDETDIANINNAKKVFRKSKTANNLFLASLLLLIILMICNFTDIDYKIIDFVAIDFVDELEFDYYLYLIPIYILAIREVFIQVKIGEFLLKYFKVEEVEIKITEEVIKPLLYKKPKKTTKNEEKNNESK